MTKKVKAKDDVVIGFRAKLAYRQELEKEGAADGRSLSNYIKYLIDTHQDRQHKAKKGK